MLPTLYLFKNLEFVETIVLISTYLRSCDPVNRRGSQNPEKYEST